MGVVVKSAIPTMSLERMIRSKRDGAARVSRTTSPKWIVRLEKMIIPEESTRLKRMKRITKWMTGLNMMTRMTSLKNIFLLFIPT